MGEGGGRQGSGFGARLLPSAATVPVASLKTYGAVDPACRKSAGAGTKRVSSDAAWAVIGVDYLTRVFVLESGGGRMGASELMKKVFELHARWKLVDLPIEDNAGQAYFVDLVQTTAVQNGITIPVRGKTTTNERTKDKRIRDLIGPVLAEGRLFVHPGLIELATDLRSFPMSPKKDRLDALSMALAVVPPGIAQQEVDRELEARLSYLRKVGADPAYIEQVARNGG